MRGFATGLLVRVLQGELLPGGRRAGSLGGAVRRSGAGDGRTGRAKAYEHHVNSYLVKPLDFDKFTKLMDDLGFYWLGWNHYPWTGSEA